MRSPTTSPRSLTFRHARSAEDEIRHLAFYDPLTNLPNRRLLLDRLRHAVLAGSRSDSAGPCCSSTWTTSRPSTTPWAMTRATCCWIRGRRLSACVREEDTVARLGGDEFVIMMEGLSLIARRRRPLARVVARKYWRLQRAL
jgi:GGDEF domain-containing protein